MENNKEKEREEKESKFVEALKKAIKDKLRGLGCKVESKGNLLYKVVLLGDKDNVQIRPFSQHKEKSKAGDYSYEVDLLIRSSRKEEFETPLVVIEAKWNSLNTHDVLTYSSKALEHKTIFPYLRYGLVVGGEKQIYNKFFTHNVGFDFAISLKADLEKTDIDRGSLEELLTVLEEQVMSARALYHIYDRGLKVKKFQEVVKVEVGSEQTRNLFKEFQEKITKEFIKECVLKRIDKIGIPKERESKKYVLVDEKENEYPPKYVISTAFELLTGFELPPDAFSGGEGGANRALRKLGFTVVPKKKKQ